MGTIYNGLEFRTRLEAHWAAFFELAGWEFWTNPAAIGNWKPDFKVKFPCAHAECNGSHILFATVMPIGFLDAVRKHPALEHRYFVRSPDGLIIGDGGALLGTDPTVSSWEISHGGSGGRETVADRVPNAAELWVYAHENVTSGPA